MRWFVGLLLLLVLPAVLFVGISQSRSGICLDSYEWSSQAGYAPVVGNCAGAAAPALGAAILFYSRVVQGVALGRSGASRENPTVSLAELLSKRGARSASVVAIAFSFLLLQAVLRTFLQRVKVRLPLLRGVAMPTLVPAGLPLPIAGFVVFALVLRVIPPGSPLDFDRASILWAGLSLFLADGVMFTLLRGGRDSLEGELGRRYAESLALWGASARDAAAEVSTGVRTSQLRGALLAGFGGLIVVESIFGINGLGETLKDLVVDREGLDPLLLRGVLLLFTLGVVLVQLAPLERLVRIWVPRS